MCMVCLEWEKGKMTALEVDRALAEMITEETTDEELTHAQEILERTRK